MDQTQPRYRVKRKLSYATRQKMSESAIARHAREREAAEELKRALDLKK
jgi:hypothetical protein